MAGKSNDSSGVPAGTWIALVAATAGVFALNRLPFQDTRPQEPRAPIYWHSPDEAQDVEARLWEDPLAAVARARAGGRATKLDPSHSLERFGKALSGPAPERVTVLGVLLGGAPYAEDTERRRRTRYAVLAGLHRSRFAPVDSEHLGYITLPAASQTATAVAAFEWLAADHTTDASGQRRVLLLWLDQAALGRELLGNYSSLLKSIEAQLRCWDFANGMCPPAASGPFVSAALIGPADSDGLRSMVTELGACASDAHCSRHLASPTPIDIFSTNATAGDDYLLGVKQPGCWPPWADQSPADGTLSPVFEQRSGGQVRLYRTLANDCTVSLQLWRELHRRGVENHREMILVMDRDTLYSRLMGDYFGGCKRAPGASSETVTGNSYGPWCFTYLRGLDGLSPPAPSSGGEDTDSAAIKSSSSVPPQNSATATDNAVGDGQFDYLRRLTAQIRETIRESGCELETAGASNCVRAVGVLGNDVYDKTMVLQALRRSFPRSIFFTTDLDARLLDKPNATWTHQLIVGSSFGLAVRPELQADIPPFRDTYQTAAFLGTLLALYREQPGSRSDPTSAPDAHEIARIADNWAANPRIFEIGRKDVFDLTRTWTGKALADGDPAPCIRPVIACLDFTPAPAPSFWDMNSINDGIRLGLYVLLIVLGALWIVRGAPEPSEDVAMLRMAPRIGAQALYAGGALIVTCVLALTFYFALQSSSNRHHAVPIFSGTSMWGSVLVEALGILAAVCLIFRGQRQIERNSVNIHRHLGTLAPDVLVSHRRRQVKRLAWRARMLEWIGPPTQTVASPLRANSARVDAGRTDAAASPLSPVERLFAGYLYRGRGAARNVRAAIATLLTTLTVHVIGYLVGSSYVDLGMFLPRGADGGEIGYLASFLSMVSIEYLVFWVADAMTLSRAFVIELEREQPAWPADALRREEGRLGLAWEPTTAWLNLRLVAMRTECIVGLVWYPSFVIGGLIIAALTVEMGPFSFLTNPVSLIICGAWALAVAALLRSAAEAMRRTAVRLLEDRKSAALAADSNGAAQLDALIDRIGDLSEGAFASYSQQPLVKAVLVPLGSYAATLLLPYFDSAALP